MHELLLWETAVAHVGPGDEDDDEDEDLIVTGILSIPNQFL